MAKSRPIRWAEACQLARGALADIVNAQGTLEEAFENLRDLQSEYSDWKDNLPEMSQGQPIEEKLDAVVDLDLEPDIEFDVTDIEFILDEVEGIDLPRGFGRD